MPFYYFVLCFSTVGRSCRLSVQLSSFLKDPKGNCSIFEFSIAACPIHPFALYTVSGFQQGGVSCGAPGLLLTPHLLLRSDRTPETTWDGAGGAPKARVAFRRAPRTPPEITREKFAENVALHVARAQKNQAFKKPRFSARPGPKYPRAVFAPIFAKKRAPSTGKRPSRLY